MYLWKQGFKNIQWFDNYHLRINLVRAVDDPSDVVWRMCCIDYISITKWITPSFFIKRRLIMQKKKKKKLANVLRSTPGATAFLWGICCIH